jgi:hypothetical protein
MKLTLPDRAEVTPAFVDLMIDIYSCYLKRVEENLRSGWSLRQVSGVNVKRIIPIVRRQSIDLHTGLDYEITRLRSAGYKKLDALERKGIRYMVGITKHITMREFNRQHSILGELGPFRVFLSDEMFTQSDMRFIHMIPERNPRSVYRHPHHYLNNLSNNQHPLEAETGNCWGNFSGPMKSVIDDPDIPELFRLLHQHLSTYGYIPPVSLDMLDYDIKTPEAK